MATYSININAGVAATFVSSGSISNHTVYTAPATGYAIVQIRVFNATGSSTASVSNAGYSTVVPVASESTASTSITVFSCYVGPSQVIGFSATATGAEIDVTGVEFIN